MSSLDEDALRALVRESVARQLGAASGTGRDTRPVAIHGSHQRYALPKTDGPCLIEPAVRCNGCGYCESHGH